MRKISTLYVCCAPPLATDPLDVCGNTIIYSVENSWVTNSAKALKRLGAICSSQGWLVHSIRKYCSFFHHHHLGHHLLSLPLCFLRLGRLSGVARCHDNLRHLRNPRAAAKPPQAGPRPLRQREAASCRAGAGGSQAKEAQHRRSNIV